jgi:hypothetical protein
MEEIGDAERVIALLEQALAGDLLLRDLESVWPSAAASNPLLRRIRDDLEFALEHVPLSREAQQQVDLTAWRQMPEYGDIRLALNYLRSHDSCQP